MNRWGRTGGEQLMRRAFNSIFFDKRDSKLIEIVNSVYDNQKSLGYTDKLLYPFFHPLGIKELAESRGLRTALSIVNLMESIERGGHYRQAAGACRS